MSNSRIVLEDDSKEPEIKLIEHRIPWLAAGLFGGFLLTVISSQFENLLAKNINLVFFIPVIIYMSGAVATQTETIYIRNAARKKVRFLTYLVKESLNGLALGVIFGTLIGGFTYFWFNSLQTALTIGLAMFVNILIAPIMALFIAKILQKENTDPALGAGPFTTVIEDLISLGVYLAIASLIVFH